MICMHQLCLPRRSIRPPYAQCKVHTRLQLISTEHIQPVLNPNPIISRRIRERKRQHPLLLQVRLMDACKAAGNHSDTREISGLERGVFAAGAFAVVPVAEDAPFDACVAVGFGDGGDGVEGLRQGVESLAAEVSGADSCLGAGKEVVRDVLEVATVFVPGAGRGDVVGCAFACEVDMCQQIRREGTPRC